MGCDDAGSRKKRRKKGCKKREVKKSANVRETAGRSGIANSKLRLSHKIAKLSKKKKISQKHLKPELFNGIFVLIPNRVESCSFGVLLAVLGTLGNSARYRCSLSKPHLCRPPSRRGHVDGQAPRCVSIGKANFCGGRRKQLLVV